MSKRLKTAPELERLILVELRRHAICAGLAAVTVREVTGVAQSNWEVVHLNALGGEAGTDGVPAQLDQDQPLELGRRLQTLAHDFQVRGNVSMGR